MLDWVHPYSPLLFLPAAALLWWFDRHSLRPLSEARRKVLLGVRAGLVLLVLLAIAGPAWQRLTDQQAVIVVLDHSQSLGEAGGQTAREKANALLEQLPRGTQVGFVSAGKEPVLRESPRRGASVPEWDAKLMAESGGQTDLSSAVTLACGLFPSGASRRIVLVTDGQETRGDVAAAARDAALLGVVVDAIPIAGERRPDVRVVSLTSNKSRSHEGAALELRAEVESSLDGAGTLRLFENGVEVESRPVELKVGQKLTQVFHRTPEERNLYTYRVRVETGSKAAGDTKGKGDSPPERQADTIPENDEAMTLVDVRGRPVLLYVEGEADQSHYLVEAMAREGIRLQTRTPAAFPQSLQDLAGYDGVILSDVPAYQLSERGMTLIRDYVEQLGGGFVMVGGKNSFGVGGYYRTPIEDVLPVKMKAPDKEERFATALSLVIDRSGSMSGGKLEICKSASAATVDLMTAKDYVHVVAFDDQAHVVVPITRVTDKSTIRGQIGSINVGGGTNIFPGMTVGRAALQGVKTKVKHMIVLTDGQTGGTGYQALATAMKGEGITISTVGVGAGADVGLLQQIAAAGGGTFYETLDPANIPRIFTQDAMVHMGRLIREEAFSPKHVEKNLMLKGVDLRQAPTLLGYVKTNRKATAAVPLVTDLGDPLLAHWQFGLGKVTAFTSDCKSRWAALWLTGWPGYNQFWAQLLRETASKPQSPLMDLQLVPTGNEANIQVDLLADAAQFKNDASIAADVYFVAAGSLGSNMEELERVQLRQTGPGRYEGRFLPRELGVYLVRARAGSQVVSAGLVHNISGEAATGQTNEPLLQKVCELTGGSLLTDLSRPLPAVKATHSHYAELTSWILRLFLLLFVIDVGVRRWENVLGMFSLLTRGKFPT